MYNHAPADYKNPFLLLAAGQDCAELYSKPEDIFYQNDTLTAFVAGEWRINNPGSIMIIPNQEYENLYDIPDDVLATIHQFSKQVAIAMKKTFECDGTSIRQHNEQAGNQRVWHYHLHVIPRYENDRLYQLHDECVYPGPAERAPYVTKLRDYFASNT